MNMQLVQTQTLLEQFFSAPERGGDCFDIHQFYGALAAIMSCPEYISEVDVAFLILGQEAKGVDQWFDNEQIRRAWVMCMNNLDEELALGRFDLQQRYLQEPNQQTPTEAFSRWCQGYLQGYLLTEDAWNEAYEFLSEEGLSEAEENHLALLTMLAAMADFETTIQEHDDPEALLNNLPEAFDAINEGVKNTFQLAMLLEENRLQSESARKTIIRHSPKIGRNDPCPCGSGRKYKKCCLHLETQLTEE